MGRWVFGQKPRTSSSSSLSKIQIFPLQVRFESGPVGGQAVEVRVSKESLAEEREVNTLLTGDGAEVCGGPGAEVDGVTTMDICCSLPGRFVTIQATDSAVSALEISDIRITVAATACPDGPPTCQVKSFPILLKG